LYATPKNKRTIDLLITFWSLSTEKSLLAPNRPVREQTELKQTWDEQKCVSCLGLQQTAKVMSSGKGTVCQLTPVQLMSPARNTHTRRRQHRPP
jgi:hypothetical protein